MLPAVVFVEQNLSPAIDDIRIAAAAVERECEILHHHGHGKFPHQVALTAVPELEGKIHVKDPGSLSRMAMGIDKSIGSAIRESAVSPFIPTGVSGK